jgi:hypothetical protein
MSIFATLSLGVLSAKFIFYCYAECRYAECRYAECRYAECRYAEWRYAECRYAECRGAGFGDKTTTQKSLKLV